MEFNCRLHQDANAYQKKHLYLRPHPCLRKAIAHYTYMQNQLFTDESRLTLVPDASGCIVIQVRDTGLSCRFWGGTTTVTQVHADASHTYFHFFIEFLPGGAFAFLHHNQAVYSNQILTLDTVFPSFTAAISKLYETSETLIQFAQGIDTLFLNRLEMPNRSIPFIQQQLHQGQTIASITASIGYSQRHLQRLFQTQIGCTMKEYQRIARVNRAVHYLQTSIDPLREIAQLCGFYDEAHFLHDFQSVMNLTPRTYQKQMSVFYNELYKF